MNKKILGTLVSFLTLTACAHAQPESQDPYQWLEEVESKEALTWVKEHNEKSLKDIQADPNFNVIKDELEKILLAKDRVAAPSFRDGYFYNFWQDAKNPKGLWRRTTIEEYRKESPAWEVLLDLDALSAAEGKDWVWHGSDYTHSHPDQHLLMLSESGQDAVVVREYNIKDKKFVAGGFEIPLAKTTISWLDIDHVLVASTYFGNDATTNSSYARTVRLWKRGTPLEQSKVLFEAKKTDMSAVGYLSEGPEGDYALVQNQIDFYTSENYLLQKDGSLKKLEIPASSSFMGFFHGQMIVKLKYPFATAKFGEIPAGSIVAGLKDSINLSDGAEPVFIPNAKTSVSGVSFRGNDLLLDILENIKGKILSVSKKDSAWVSEDLNFPNPKEGTLSVYSASRFLDEIVVTSDHFTQPLVYYFQTYDKDGKANREVLKSSPERFDASNIEVEQKFSTSKDGTQVPYFLVKKKGLALDGKNPTILYGYGGFEIPMLPGYRAGLGKVWLERGGVYALANIRGGGEFGPTWHQAALKHNRQRAFDDFISVAEHLIASNLTSPKHLGIMGGSNGGLLMGATMTQRPELFNSVIIQVPLLDMIRYTKLTKGAGASWIAEYGDPSDPQDCSVILKYSPYQNLKKDITYPPTLFITSTHDDRVHPSHARKMAARMEEFKQPVWYFENMTGGHAASTTPSEIAFRNAVEFTFLLQKLK